MRTTRFSGRLGGCLPGGVYTPDSHPLDNPHFTHRCLRFIAPHITHSVHIFGRKVMSSQASVIPSTGRGGSGRHPPSPGQTPPGQTPPWADPPSPPEGDGYCSGRYASYWNAFLYTQAFAVHRSHTLNTHHTNICFAWGSQNV